MQFILFFFNDMNSPTLSTITLIKDVDNKKMLIDIFAIPRFYGVAIYID